MLQVSSWALRRSAACGSARDGLRGVDEGDAVLTEPGEGWVGEARIVVRPALLRVRQAWPWRYLLLLEVAEDCRGPFEGVRPFGC